MLVQGADSTLSPLRVCAYVKDYDELEVLTRPNSFQGVKSSSDPLHNSVSREHTAVSLTHVSDCDLDLDIPT